MDLSLHGGPDALGVAPWDFSSNANACGPAPGVVRALRRVDAARYPDPSYTALRECLGHWHGVEPGRIVVAGSASEFVVRMTCAVAGRHPKARVWVPRPGYGDYARAARAQGLEAAEAAAKADLVWHTEPASPGGEAQPLPAVSGHAVLVVDAAYAPLRLQGPAPPQTPTAWRLHSPNKALGLTGVRGAYAIAPEGAQAWVAALHALAPSWVLGAHGVAMLQCWTEVATQQWLARSLLRLRRWRAQQLALCARLGWTCRAGVTPYFTARWDAALPLAQVLARLRAQGVKLRDTGSMGLPGWVRLSVQPPSAQRALRQAWQVAVGRDLLQAPAPPAPRPSTGPRPGANPQRTTRRAGP